MRRIRVEVVLALPAGHDAVQVELPAGSTVGDAIAASGLASRQPGFDAARGAVGRFGVLSGRDDVLHDGDRVELYRPLAEDPKEARRRRAARRRS